MHVAIVANGQLDERLLTDIKKADYIIGVDRGAHWLLQHQITPHIAVGDFDSTSPKELAAIQASAKTIQEAPHPKDKTDLELAADHTLSLKPTTVSLYGVTGTRFDQTLAAVHMLEKFLAAKVVATIYDAHNTIALTDNTFTIMKSPDFSYFSLISYTKTSVVSIRGARYPLDRYKLSRNVSLGISNEVTGQRAIIDIHSGKTLVIQSRD